MDVPWRILVVSMALALALSHGPMLAQAPPDSPPESVPTAPVAPERADVRLSIRVSDATEPEALHFHVTFENVGSQDTVLNLGRMLANGKHQQPSAIRLVLSDPDGRVRQLQYLDRQFSGGRIDDYAVPLRAGSTYGVRLGLQNFWCPQENEFVLTLQRSGTYSVRVAFTGQGAMHLNGDTEGLKFLPFWIGELLSAEVQFQLTAR